MNTTFKRMLSLLLLGAMLLFAVSCGGETVSLCKGETVIIPACAGEYTLNGNMTAFRYWSADVDAEYLAPLNKKGFSADAVNALCGR